MNRRRIALACATVALAAVSACEKTPSGPTAHGIAAARAMWATHHLTRYAYVFETQGFFNAFDRHQIRLVILGGSVSSATDLTTGDSVAATFFPTLDGLFDEALATDSAGALKAITFDSIFSYPTRMDIAGSPDASGSIFASSLEPLP